MSLKLAPRLASKYSSARLRPPKTAAWIGDEHFVVHPVVEP
jgi:hypothetical protein